MSAAEMKTATFVLFGAGEEDGGLQALYGNRRFLGTHLVDGNAECPGTLSGVLGEFGITLKQAGVTSVKQGDLECGDSDFYYFDGEMHDGEEPFIDDDEAEDDGCSFPFPEIMTDEHIDNMF